MKGKELRVLLFVVAGLLLIALAACGGTNADTAANDAAANNSAANDSVPNGADDAAADVPELFGDALRGGLIYDKWWKTLGLDAPEEDHSLWATQDSNTRSGADTWRCKECHGWDYKGADGAYGGGSHFTGFVGVIQFSGGDANEVLAALQGATNADHDFSAYMDEQALTDLALFIAEETMDYSEFTTDDKMAVSADVALGETLYQDNCAECHGPEGLAINFGKYANKLDYVSAIANGNPWEFMHKARFGQPATEMVSVIDAGWSLEEQAALLAYAQTLPNASVITQGGQLYDKWWKSLHMDDAPEGEQPLWATQDTNTRDGGDTFRCKECHGWDYRGAEGAYAGGSHFTGFTGVYGSTDVLAWLDGTNSADHDFSAYMDADALNMLASFVEEGLVDFTLYVNYDDKSVIGDATSGQASYEIACARCHGDDGKAMNFGDDDNPKYLGDLAADNPWEVMHKAANGQPATAMPSALNLGWSWQDIADVVAYLQTLASE